MKTKTAVIFVLILLFSAFLRFYKLADIPRGFYIDEASLGYNAYSFLLTGRDEFGKAFPVFLRSFGVYASPLYTYFLVPLVGVFGLTVSVNRSLCAASGVLIVLLTYIYVRKLRPQAPGEALLAGLLVAVSPWSVFFSRGTFEANLALLLTIAGLAGLNLSLRKPRWLPVSAFILALSAYAYQGPRLVSSLLFLGFLVLNRRFYQFRIRQVVLSIAVFLLTISPQLFLLGSSGTLTRLTGQAYPSGHSFIWEFASQYTAYFSPRNLFYYPDFDLQRSLPDLSVFYAWMGIPLVFGIAGVIRRRKDPWVQSLVLLMVLSPIPAALVRDPFAVWRTLPHLWVLTVFIAWGLSDILRLMKSPGLTIGLAAALIIVSLVRLYSSA